jgi:hypothetical protein
MPVHYTPEAVIILIELVLASPSNKAVLMFWPGMFRSGPGGNLKCFRALLASYGPEFKLPGTGPCFTYGQLVIGCDKYQSRSEARGSTNKSHIGLGKVVGVDM